MKQPRVPEYRESEGVPRHLKALTLFLKDFTLETWKSTQTLSKEGGAGMFVFSIDERGHLLCTYDTTKPPPLSIDERGHLIYTMGG